MGSYDVSNENKTDWRSQCGERTVAGTDPMAAGDGDPSQAAGSTPGEAAGAGEGVQGGCPAAGAQGTWLGNGTGAAGQTCTPSAL